MKWINFKEQKPPYGVPVLAYHHLWVDEDFNPQGIREGFLEDNLASDEVPYDFVSAHWWDYQDTYMTISKCNLEGHEQEYGEEILNSIIPEYWAEIPPCKEKYQSSYDYDKVKRMIAIGFMHILDDMRPEGKMCLSNGECADIDKAFDEQDWGKLYRYMEKYKRPSTPPKEEPDEDMDCGMACGCCGG